MRLVDLLLVLLFEGRTALPKSNIGTTARTMSGLRRLDSAGERSHRHLIDCIRSKDTDALIDAIDTGGKGTSLSSITQIWLYVTHQRNFVCIIQVIRHYHVTY